jgi:hypothetical protein
MRECYMNGNFIGVRGITSVVEALRNDNNMYKFEISKKDLCDDSYRFAIEDNINSCNKVIMKIRLPFECRVMFYWCLKMKRIYLSDDCFFMIFEFLTHNIYQQICIRNYDWWIIIRIIMDYKLLV